MCILTMAPTVDSLTPGTKTCRAKGELVTPTGISLVKALTSAYGEPPAFIPTHTGVGAGTKEFPYHANIVRVAIGKKIDPNAIQKAYASAAMATSWGLPETRPSSSTDTTASATGSLPYDQEDVLVLETNLDDLNPQAFGYVFERLLGDGHALDVWTQPIQMKKSRPGVCLRCFLPTCTALFASIQCSDLAHLYPMMLR